MTDDSEAPTNSASSLRSKLGTFSFVGAILFIVAMLLYMGNTPVLLHWPIRILIVAAIAYLVFAAFQKIRSTKFEGKKVVFSLIIVAFLYGALFLICAVFIKLMSAKDEQLTTVKTTALTEKSNRGVKAMLSGDSPSLYDQDIGWVPRPGFSWKMHSISEQGLRGTRVYPETPEDPDKRILCVGDSFTFGYEVEDDQTYPHHAEQLLPGTEWINLGICGGGLTQSYLHYKKNGRRFGGKYVVIGFMTNNNKRTVNCFRPFVSPDDPMTPLTKPFAKLSNGEFSIEPNPYQDVSDYEKLLADERGELRRLYELDYFTWSEQKGATNPIMRTFQYVWDRRYCGRNLDILLNRPVDDSFGKFRSGDDPYGQSLWHPESPGFQANMRVFDAYYNDVIADGRIPLIAIFPSAKDVEERAKGRSPKHEALIDYLDEKGYRYFDFLDSLEVLRKDQLTKEALYGNTHFNGETNKLLAEEIIKALELN